MSEFPLRTATQAEGAQLPTSHLTQDLRSEAPKSTNNNVNIAKSHLSSLPLEIKFRIVDFVLAEEDLVSLRLVDRDMHLVASSALFKEMGFSLDYYRYSGSDHGELLLTKWQWLENVLSTSSSSLGSLGRFFRHVNFHHSKSTTRVLIDPNLAAEMIIGLIPDDVLTSCEIKMWDDRIHRKTIRLLAALFRSQRRLSQMIITADHCKSDGLCHILPRFASKMESLQTLSLRYWQPPQDCGTIRLWETLVASLPGLRELEIQAMYDDLKGKGILGAMFKTPKTMLNANVPNLTALMLEGIELDDRDSKAFRSCKRLQGLKTLFLKDCRYMSRFLKVVTPVLGTLQSFVYQKCLVDDFTDDPADGLSLPGKTVVEELLLSFKGLRHLQFFSTDRSALLSPESINHHAATLESLSLYVDLTDHTKSLRLPPLYSTAELSTIISTCTQISFLSLDLPSLIVSTTMELPALFETDPPTVDLPPFISPPTTGSSLGPEHNQELAGEPFKDFWEYLSIIFSSPKLRTFKTDWLPIVPSTWSGLEVGHIWDLENDSEDEEDWPERKFYTAAYESFKNNIVSSILERFGDKCTSLESITLGSGSPIWLNRWNAWPRTQEGIMVGVGISRSECESIQYRITNNRNPSTQHPPVWERIAVDSRDGHYPRFVPKLGDYF